MKITLPILICLLPMLSFAQDEYQMKKNSEEIEFDFLSSYYNQDGNNAAVTGGIGTEQLTDFANIFVVNVPLDSTRAINASIGADAYTSASTDNIDNHVSSASIRDTRIYGTLGYTQKKLKRGETYGGRLGFSKEYDYTSFSAGLTWAKEWNEGNSEINLNGQAFFDSWSLIYPQELRSEVSLASPNRRSYDFQTTYSQVLNKRMQVSISGEAIYMSGLLSTPFHRVYFSDQARPDIERLPDTRLKIPLGLQFNYFPFDNFIIRTNYRYYWDDWGMNAHTVSIETPVKLSSSLTISPFYRYHTQTAADYFAPYEVHTTAEMFYTSDYDLSKLNSHKIGIGFKYSPLYGVGRMKLIGGKKLLKFDSINLRTAYYTRSTGLNAVIVSLGLSFKIK